jgi:hypothetical protein
MVILAPAITAPDGSLTVPLMLPVPTVVWAHNGHATFPNTKTAKNITTARSTSRAATHFMRFTWLDRQPEAPEQVRGSSSPIRESAPNTSNRTGPHYGAASLTER